MEHRKLASLKMNVRNDQIFRNLSADEITELADSIKTNGLINPITIRPDGTIIAGHQRYRAACYAFEKDKKTAEIPCIVRDVTDREARRIWISENIHRRNLSIRETILGNYLLVLDKVAELSGLGDSESIPLGGMDLKSLTEGNLIDAISQLIAGGHLHHKKSAVYRHVLIASGLVNDLQALVFDGKLSQHVGSACASLPKDEQQKIADMIASGELAIEHADEYQRELKEIKRLNKQMEKENERLLEALADAANDADSIVNAQMEHEREQHQKEIDRLNDEIEAKQKQLEKIAKQAEVIATRAKYDKLIQSILLLDSMASKGTAQQAMASRIQFGIYDESFIQMMEHVSAFLAECVKETRKQAFQDRAKSNILKIAR